MTDEDEDGRGALGRVTAHRLAVELMDAAAGDAESIVESPAYTVVAAQLLGAVGSIAARISEGYVRRSHADRARYYEYAHGSAEEARDWYRQARRRIPAAARRARNNTLTSICRLLTTMIRNERREDGTHDDEHTNENDPS